jgi:hypothetical protein
MGRAREGGIRAERKEGERKKARRTSDHIPKKRTICILIDLDSDLVLPHQEREVEHVLDGLGERVRVDDEGEVGDAVFAAGVAEYASDL